MKRIHLIRHGLSVSNVDISQNQHTPDHLIPLDPRGHLQAVEAGRALAIAIKKGSRRVQVLVSPYLRTKQTAEGVKKGYLAELNLKDDLFEMREALTLREQNFGLWNGYNMSEIKDMFPSEYVHYQKHVDAAGEFFASMPMGESQAEVCDRVRNMFGGIIRNFQGECRSPVTDVVLIGHGVSNRCFIKEWMHKEWEWLEESKNPFNCSITTLEGDVDFGWEMKATFTGFDHPKDEKHELQEMREEGHLV